MSHFTVLVLTNVTGNFNKTIEDLLEPYDKNRLMPPYKDRFSLRDMYRMAKYYKTIDPRKLIDKMEDWHGQVGGIDWRGLFGWSQYNLDSKWDWYKKGGRWDDGIPNNQCMATDLPNDFVPFAFVTPDGIWHEKGRMLWFAMVADEKEEAAWRAEYLKAIKSIPILMATLIDYHI